MSFDKYLKELDNERQRQVSEGYTDLRDTMLSPSDWIAQICRQAGLGIDNGVTLPNPRFRRQLLQTAAVALAGLAAYDRREKSINTTTRGSHGGLMVSGKKRPLIHRN